MSRKSRLRNIARAMKLLQKKNTFDGPLVPGVLISGLVRAARLMMDTGVTASYAADAFRRLGEALRAQGVRNEIVLCVDGDAEKADQIETAARAASVATGYTYEAIIHHFIVELNNGCSVEEIISRYDDLKIGGTITYENRNHSSAQALSGVFYAGGQCNDSRYLYPRSYPLREGRAAQRICRQSRHGETHHRYPRKRGD